MIQHKISGALSFALSACLLLHLLAVPCGAEMPEQRVIRVAFPLQAGLTEIDEYGKYSGLTYEYLEEIAQYTGWDYEFVQVPGDLNQSLVIMMEMLKNGELDLMGGILFNEELAEQYDYIGHSYGTVNTVLNVLYGNTSIDPNNYQTLEGIRIAVIERSVLRRQELDQFCASNNIQYDVVPCDNEKEQIQALEEGRADALLNVDMNYLPNLRQIAKFSPKPYFFITTKGNQEIVQQLNSAIMSINEVDPYFSITLYEKYFTSRVPQLFLTDSNTKYIEQADVLRVGVLNNQEPIQWVDKKTGEAKGIAIDLLQKISDLTGLHFQMIPVSSSDELQKKIDSQEVDLVASMRFDYDDARKKNLSMTKSYATAQYTMLINRHQYNGDMESKRLAMTKDTSIHNGADDNVLWFDTTEDCIKAVNDGIADYTYGNGFAVQYYSNIPTYKNIRLLPQTYPFYSACIGVAQTNDRNLLSILNKAINSISEEEIQSIILQNTTSWQSFSLMDLINAYPVESILTVSGASILFIGVLLNLLLQRMRANKKAQMDLKKHYQLYELSNECFFEYDYKKNELMVSTQSPGETPPFKQSFYHGPQSGDDESSERTINFFHLITSKKDGSTEAQFLLPNNELKWLRLTMRTIYDDNNPVYTVGKITNIDDEKREKENLLARAQEDGLTGLLNAAVCKKTIQQYLTETKSKKHNALFILDIDFFKSINDDFGHYTGDAIIVKVAQALRSTFREQDILGRLGGDEFIIYMTSIPGKEIVEEKCRHLCKIIRAIPLPDSERQISISVGAALAHPGQDFNSLYQMTDGALYQAKRNGRNGYVIAD